MTKVNFSKVEKSFDKALQKLLVDNLFELAAIANVIQDPEKNISNAATEEIICRFQKDLKKIKKENFVLFEKLNLTTEEEEHLYHPPSEYTQEDWLLVRELKTRIDQLKRDLYGQQTVKIEDSVNVEKERRRHINKRFNVRDGWLPLK